MDGLVSALMNLPLAPERGPGAIPQSAYSRGLKTRPVGTLGKK